MKIVNSAEMREIEGQCESEGIPTSQLMENAGRAFAEEVREWMDGVTGKNVLVLVGPGNNGGDGLVAARYLHDWIANVYVFLCSPRSESDPNLKLVIDRELDPIAAYEEEGLAALREGLRSAEVVVDAVLGTGRSRPISGNIEAIISEVRKAKESNPNLRVAAMDLPSGVDADSGQGDQAGLPADFTVALGYPKIGMFAFPGASMTGRLAVADIGIPEDLSRHISLEMLTGEKVRELLPRRPADAHKGSFGRVVALAGSGQYVGAAYLACAAATRVGAGLVTLACSPVVRSIVASRAAEVTYIPLEETAGVQEWREAIDEGVKEADALLVGCGLGRAESAWELAKDLLLDSPLTAPPAVVDADGLNALASEDGWWKKLGREAVLTPHPGEMSRLMGASTGEVQRDRIGTAREAARKWGKTVVLKGAHTVVARADGHAVVSPFANPALASAGTGDVLAGTIAGLLAQGLGAWEAAMAGVYLHGLAGEMGREEVGEAGLLASDLLPLLPRAIRGVGEG